MIDVSQDMSKVRHSLDVVDAAERVFLKPRYSWRLKLGLSVTCDGEHFH